MGPATLKLAEFVNGASTGSLPASLYPLAKTYVLDTLGVAVFGSTRPWSQMVARYANRLSQEAPGSKSSVLGTGWRSSPAFAALVNGTAGHAFELDDVHDESLLHPGTVVIPAALAVAEDVGASGTEFLTSVIAGYELMVRAGLGVGALSHMMGGFHATGTNGVFGSAASTAKLLNLDTDAVAHALGVSGSLAGGIMEFSQSGGMVKRLHAGRAAEGGVLAGYLASDGFTGPPTVLEGPFGYCEVFSSKPEPERLLAGLGEKFAVEEITIKPYACCSDLHGTIDCIKAIRAQADIEPEQIRRITIHTYEKVIRQNALDGSASVMAAQYSIPFTAAASLFHDLGDPRSYSEDVIVDPRITELAGKVELKRDDAFQALYPRKMPTRVVVETAGGQEYGAEVIGAKGHFENPLSREEVEAKFRLLTADVLSPTQAEEAIAAVEALDSAASLDRLVAALTPLADAQGGNHAVA